MKAAGTQMPPVAVLMSPGMKNRFAQVMVGLAVWFAGGAYAAAPKVEAEGVSPVPIREEALREHTVLLLGDSLIATSFGEHLESRLDSHPLIRCKRRAKTSSGLARPDFFDWMEEGQREVVRHNPEVVVVILGGNDGQPLLERKGRGGVSWGKPEWEPAYRQRVESFLQVLAAPGRRVLWLALPPTGLPRFERKLELIRRIQREALAGREDTVHFDTSPLFTDAKGKPLREARVQGFRKPRALKMEDGVHFTLAGGHYFANKVYPEVLDLLGLGEEPQKGTVATVQD